MKILTLRFKNLNSLCGEWVIDFTNPEYTSNGIFALTGPTGAGKSTILDAICLALYGATPRLGRITKNDNQIMSRQTSECYAEVVFESQTGRFLCHWKQHRANKKSDGPLQDPKHEIADASTDKLIETKKSLVAKVIEEKTGMDFDRFTRSILLAQGGFDTFLKADSEQKSKILEQITGTEIYSKISQRVHERQRGEREKFSLLQEGVSGIIILTPEDEDEIQLNLNSKRKQEKESTEQIDKIKNDIIWLDSINKLINDIGSLSKEEEKLLFEIEAFKPENDRLTRALKAHDLEGPYATLNAVRKEQANDQNNLKSKKDKLPELEESAKKHIEDLEIKEHHTSKVKEDQKKAVPIIQEVRLIDQTLTEKEKTINKQKELYQQDLKSIESNKKLKSDESKKQIKASNDVDLAKKYLKDHSEDEWLVSGLAGIKEQLSTLQSKQETIATWTTNRQNAENSLDESIKGLNTAKTKCMKGKEQLKQTKKSLEEGQNVLSILLGDHLLREYRKEKETLLREQGFLRTIKTLENHRTELEDGKPCPLCGSKKHPFFEGNIPTEDETEKKISTISDLIEKAEKQEEVIRKLEKAESEAQKKLSEYESSEKEISYKKETAKNTLSTIESGLKKDTIEYLELKKALLDKLQPLSIEEIPDLNTSSLVESLQDRLKQWETQVEKKDKLEKLLLKIHGELEKLHALIEQQDIELQRKKKALESLEREYLEERLKRQKLYEDKDPTIEERLLNKAIDNAEQAEDRARDQHSTTQRDLHSTKNAIFELENQIKRRVSELTKLETDFITSLQSVGFPKEEQFYEARLALQERSSLEDKRKELEHRKTDLKTRQNDRKANLAEEMAKNITNEPLEELNTQLQKLNETLEHLREEIAHLNYKLTDNTQNKDLLKEKRIAIEAQEKEYSRWRNLYELIGSEDGKKYRNFAQGLTFELMVSHANRQLAKMTDRYLLIRDDKQSLELNVVDNYQAGEIRPTKNLSGGESFIVSLTLALGLSKMASQKVRVDSLFLDEGFGTLDEEALETALETLSGLQEEGKLIGIISHVSALKERIDTQITVTPLSGGKSILTGPGCHKK